MTYKVFLKDLGNKLKMQRKKLGLTQSELVEKINKGLNKMMMIIYLINRCQGLSVVKTPLD